MGLIKIDLVDEMRTEYVLSEDISGVSFSDVDRDGAAYKVGISVRGQQYQIATEFDNKSSAEEFRDKVLSSWSAPGNKTTITKFKDGTSDIPDSIDTLGLSTRTINSLKTKWDMTWCDEIKTIGELTKLSPTKILIRPNLGRKCLREIEEKLAERGLRLSG